MAMVSDKSYLKHASNISRLNLLAFALIFGLIGGYAIFRSFAATNPNLLGDLNNDNTVNQADLTILTTNFGTTNSTADINSDGKVNVLDLSILLSSYGQSVAAQPPPSAMIHGMYDSNGTQPAFTADWPNIAAQDINMLILPSEWISNLQTLKAAGDSAWVTAGYWDNSNNSFSLSQAQAVSDVSAACAVGVVKGIYVADEPSTDGSGISAIKARATALKAACPSAQTILSYYDAPSVSSWKGVTDAIALDVYPSRFSFNNNLITQLAATADAAGIQYYGVVGAFTDGTSNYPLPSAAQLTSMFNAWEATNELGWAVYSWGATGGSSSTQLQNQPSLLSVIKSNADKN